MKRLLKAGLLCTSLMLAGATLAHASVNLLTNPGFEDGGGSYTGYFTFGAGNDPVTYYPNLADLTTFTGSFLG